MRANQHTALLHSRIKYGNSWEIYSKYYSNNEWVFQNYKVYTQAIIQASKVYQCLNGWLIGQRIFSDQCYVQIKRDPLTTYTTIKMFSCSALYLINALKNRMVVNRHIQQYRHRLTSPFKTFISSCLLVMLQGQGACWVPQERWISQPNSLGKANNIEIHFMAACICCNRTYPIEGNTEAKG